LGGAALLFPLYPSICQQLLAETGIDSAYIQSGMLIKPPYDEKLALDWCKKPDDLFLLNAGQVRNPKLM
jgi:hypothetical protein